MNDAENRTPRRKKPVAPVVPDPVLVPPPENMDFDHRLQNLPLSFGTRWGTALINFLSPCSARITIVLDEAAHGCDCGGPHHAYLDLQRRTPASRWRRGHFHAPNVWLSWDDSSDEGVVLDPRGHLCVKDVYAAAVQHLGFHPTLPFDTLGLIYARGVHECHYRLQEYARAQEMLAADRQQFNA